MALSAVLAAGVGLSGSEGATAASRSVVEVVNVPSSGTLTVAGRGSGHGRGMSQWGARGAALQGIGYEQILRSYYPGTALRTRSASEVRVDLTVDSDDITTLVDEPGLTYSVGALGSGALEWKGSDVDRWRITRSADGSRLVIDAEIEARWKRWATTPSGEPLQIAALDRTISLLLPGGRVTDFRGAISAVADGRGTGTRTVNDVQVEDYLRSVVPSEVPAGWPRHAIRAQAVAARTYVLFEIAEDPGAAWHTCDTTACQMYRGIQSRSHSGTTTRYEHATTNAEVAATARQRLEWNGAPAFTQFSASNGGWSVAGSMPYLRAAADPWDHVGNPSHTWSTRVATADLTRAFPGIGTVHRLIVHRRDGNGAWAGRVMELEVLGTRGSTRVSGERARFALGLKSSWWKVTGSSRLDSDVAARGAPSLLARADDGALRRYDGDGRGAFVSSRQIGHGWDTMRILLRANDLDNDGATDILAIDSAGVLWRYPMTLDGTVLPRIRIGGGWSSTTRLIGAADADKDGVADVLAVRDDGRLFLYRGDGAGSLHPGRQVGHGWNTMTRLVALGDYTGDGVADVLGTDRAGRLFVYQGNGAGWFTSRVAVGHGWNTMRLLSAVGDWDGDGRPDILATNARDELVMYPGTASLYFDAPQTIGWKWGWIDHIM